eukprot:GFUD01007846.1.p1 GENE.GFUD01007846.1~~GFUD01007846.1.p1  ORF type:complete len:415 (+),score=108.80 GFUD01007846.1:58-1302(+)
MELNCSVQSYAWGKVGSDSQVARLAAKACQNFQVSEEQTYAELWMGTHANGPSQLTESGDLLSEYIAKNPEVLGSKIREKFGDQLPYLFKVLSVNKALSIQAHPNKQHAEQLHEERPNIYKDPNHKPEIAVALTDFEGLCGFRPLSEIQNFLKTVPELKSAVGEKADTLISAGENNYQDALKDCFESLMVCDPSVLKKELQTLSSRLSSPSDNTSLLFNTLYSQYPGDVGCFVIYFLNHLRLDPGQAMFLGPNVPHAYLSGDCIECMANSDNVVRAGLTPKLIDVPTLVSMLDYTCAEAESRKFSPSEGSTDTCQEFDPPVPDFAVARYEVPGDANNFSLTKRDSASIILITEGSGKYLASHEVTNKGGLTVVEPFATADISAGSVLFLPSDKVLEVFPEDCPKLVFFQAYCKL